MALELDNSAARNFWKCPTYYQERYVYDIEPKDRSQALDFGTRVHNLLERHFGGHGEDTPLEDSLLEAEAQATFEAYKAQYPVESFDVVDVEKFLRVPLVECAECKGTGRITTRKFNINLDSFYETIENCVPCDGTGTIDWYTGKLDLVVRLHENNRLQILDHKTEERNGRNNTPLAWQHKSQVALYQWAATQIYGEEIYNICIDVIRRSSPAGRFGPEFRRITTQRTQWQCDEAVKDLRYVAEQIRELQQKYPDTMWPTNRDSCIWCPYALIHGETGRDESILAAKYSKAREYRYK